MPRGDRTGPDGMGPMTGRGLGFCSGYDSPGFLKATFRAAFGRGPGAGMGRGRVYSGRMNYPAESLQYEKRDELQYMKEEAQQMKTKLDALNARIEELEKK